MAGCAAEADVRRGRDRAATVSLILAALGAFFFFVDAIGATLVADPGARVTESWRMYGFLVFAGLFVLLALRPRRSPCVWELVVFHKTAVAVTAAMFVRTRRGRGPRDRRGGGRCPGGCAHHRLFLVERVLRLDDAPRGRCEVGVIGC